jgi:hypothetical protein
MTLQVKGGEQKKKIFRDFPFSRHKSFFMFTTILSISFCCHLPAGFDKPEFGRKRPHDLQLLYSTYRGHDISICMKQSYNATYMYKYKFTIMTNIHSQKNLSFPIFSVHFVGFYLKNKHFCNETYVYMLNSKLSILQAVDTF